MACFKSNDLIGYPGLRKVARARPTTGAALRLFIKTNLALCGWVVEQRDYVGINSGTGFIATSLKHPWCSEQDEPEDFVGQTKVYFYPLQTFDPGQTQFTNFELRTFDEETIINNSITLRPATDYDYMFIGNPYTFIVIMLGIEDRINNAISSSRTSIIAGHPQIPEILQEDDDWCKLGIKEEAFILQFDGMRSGALISNFSQWLGYIRKGSDLFINNNVGSFHFPFISGDASDGKSSSKILHGDIEEPDQWQGLFHPTVVSWPTETDHPEITRKKGFLWDTVVFSKGLQGDAKLVFDGHEYINLIHNAQGNNSPYRAGGSLLAAIKGTP